MTEISIFDGQNRFENRKPLRLIELFAGYGSQHLALKYLGVPCESYAISEWAIKSIQAYKDMHEPDDDTDYGAEMTDDEIRAFLKGRISRDYSNPLTDAQIDKMKIDEARLIYNNMRATKNLGSVCAIKADDIPLDDEHTYLLTYSFPCQDLSLAGLRKGMDEDSGTRSGLLWEVNRLLHEWDGLGKLPDVLLMENVPEVVGKKNRRAWERWIANLDSLGYRSYWKILNATDYGIPQNRRRCFMISIRGDYYFDFPLPIGLPIRLKHVLEPVEMVDESYYLRDELVESLVLRTKRNAEKGNGFGFSPVNRDDAEKSKTILTKEGTRMPDNYIDEAPICQKVGDLTAGGYERMFEESRRVYSPDGACPTLHTACGDDMKAIKILAEVDPKLQIVGDLKGGSMLTDSSSASTSTTLTECHRLSTPAPEAGSKRRY